MEQPILGIYTVSGNGKTIGSLAEKLPKGKLVFMVTQISADEGEMHAWCAELVPAGAVPSDKQKAGNPMWKLDGHPRQGYFILDGSNLLECDQGFNRRRIWCRSTDGKLQGGFFRELPTLPCKIFPSENFKAAVLGAEPSMNEPYSPSTQVVVEACCNVQTLLPEDSVDRQKELVRLYTAETPLYHEMNSSLREDHLFKMQYFGSYIKELRDVFKTDHEDQIITPFEGNIWRGITYPDPVKALEEFTIGTEFVWPAFTSMTTNKDVALSWGNVAFEIECRPPAGTYDDDIPEYAPACISEFSCYPCEAEVLCPPNISFRVLRIDHPNDENQLSHPLVVCKVVGFDTDSGIQQFASRALSGLPPAAQGASCGAAPRVESPEVNLANGQADTEEVLRRLEHFRARLDEETSRFSMSCAGLELRLQAVEGKLKECGEKETSSASRLERHSLETMELRVAALESAHRYADGSSADRGGSLVARLESKLRDVEKDLHSMQQHAREAGGAVDWRSLDIKRLSKDVEDRDERIDSLMKEFSQQLATTDKSVRLSLEKLNASEQRQSLSDQRIRNLLTTHGEHLQELEQRYQEVPKMIAERMGHLHAGTERGNVGTRKQLVAGKVAAQLNNQVLQNLPWLPGVPSMY